MRKFILLLICLFPIIAYCASESLSLEALSMTIYPCAHPSKGFVKTGFAVNGTNYNPSDSFVFDFANKVFIWNDNKGRSRNKMYNIIHNGNVCSFVTEYNSVRLQRLTNGYIVDIIYRSDDNCSYMITYNCN